MTKQAVEAAETVSAEFEDDAASDGLLGLAFDSINTASPKQVATFFENAIPTLAAPLFTANLKKGEPGNYNFGYIDSSEYTGSITYTAVNTANGFWEFTGTGYAVGSGSFVSTSIDAIADTGTTLLYLPAAAVKAYYAKVSGATNSASQGGYIFPCSATLPSITLGIGSYRAVVPGSYINYAPATGSGKFPPCLCHRTYPNDPTDCFGGIQSDAGIGFAIYGDIFLKSQFVVFNGARYVHFRISPSLDMVGMLTRNLFQHTRAWVCRQAHLSRSPDGQSECIWTMHLRSVILHVLSYLLFSKRLIALPLALDL